MMCMSILDSWLIVGKYKDSNSNVSEDGRGVRFWRAEKGKKEIVYPPPTLLNPRIKLPQSENSAPYCLPLDNSMYDSKRIKICPFIST